MECLVCGVEIRRNDVILMVAEAVYNGPCEDDVTYQFGEERVDGTIHLECLKDAGDTARTSNTDVVKAVVRSDALLLFEH